GTEWWGKALLVTFGALPKVTRRKGGTASRRYKKTGYTHKPQVQNKPLKTARSPPKETPLF
ncbi:hypothetical protein, partial [Pseudomonas brassicacearum]|uniref:hypothetical protein n=1 Tax=Pseudomonas brassicacearum TaxID=930166 RepID=UPI00286A4488